MKKKSILLLLSSLSSAEKSEFKRVYKYLENEINVDWNSTLISYSKFKKILKLSRMKIKGIDISLAVGFKYFRNTKLFLSKGVFIPQYDTEPIIDLLPKATEGQKLLEVGTGTGAIAICSYIEKNYITTSIDINKKATKLAIKNAKLNNANIKFINKNFFNYTPNEKYDVLISNPPYIIKKDINVEEWVKKNQPANSLYAEENGLKFYKKIIIDHKIYIKENGIIIFEIGHNQAKSIKEIVNKISHKSIKIYKDLDGKFDRFVVIEF